MRSEQLAPRRVRRRWLFAVGALVAALVVAVPLAWASHDFTDVPDASPFHGDIGAVRDAGITSGKTCIPPGTPPTYCPLEGITREAMAAFVHRGFGRVAFQQGGSFALPTNGNLVVVREITLNIGGAAGGTQFVKVDASVGTTILSTTGCPCNTGYFLSAFDLGQATFLHTHTNADVAPMVGGGERGEEIGAISAVFAVPTASTQRFRLVARRPSSSTGDVGAYAELTAITAPFGSTGGSTLGVGEPVVPLAPSGSPPPSPSAGS